MEAVGNTTIKINPFKAIGKTIIAIWIGFLAFGESAGRARAAAELSRQGYHAEAKRLMLEKR
jgi:hypothetical protein